MISVLGLLLFLASAPLPSWIEAKLHELDGSAQLKQNPSLSQAERGAITATMIQLLPNAKEAPKDESIGEMRVEKLPGTSPQLYAVQASGNLYCGATGNCGFWVLAGQPGGFKLVLHAIATQMFAVEPSRSGSYPDFALSSHGSAFESEIKLFRFDGTKYLRQACYHVSYPLTDSDSDTRAKEPVVKEFPCSGR